MANIVDRRQTNKNASAPNRKRFIDRYKKRIKQSVNDAIQRKTIQDIGKKNIDVAIPEDDITEPEFRHASDKGDWDHTYSGNEHLSRGDIIPIPSGEGGTGAGSDDQGEDEFMFTLTKEEFMDIFFEDMALPDFLKKSLKETTEVVKKRAGFTKEGIPARLNIKKTFEQAIARRIATQSKGKRPRFLDDVDIRYDYFTDVKKPVRHAVMFCTMDVSLSMGENEKLLSKKFFLLLYLFLTREYEKIEIVFVRYHSIASEVSEHEFFYSRDSGGTILSHAFELIKEIIEERYNVNETNIYIAHSSDGDNWLDDNKRAMLLASELCDIVQYFAYIQVCEQRHSRDLWHEYEALEITHRNFRKVIALQSEEIYPVLHELFKTEV